MGLGIDLIANPLQIVGASANDRSHDQFRVVIGVPLADTTDDVIGAVGTSLDLANPFTRLFQLALPSINAGYRSGELHASRQSLLDKSTSDRFENLNPVGRRRYLNTLIR
jgi:hypothetical protein